MALKSSNGVDNGPTAAGDPGPPCGCYGRGGDPGDGTGDAALDHDARAVGLWRALCTPGGSISEMCGPSPDVSAKSGAKQRSAYWTTEIKGDWGTGKSFILAASSARAGCVHESSWPLIRSRPEIRRRCTPWTFGLLLPRAVLVSFLTIVFVVGWGIVGFSLGLKSAWFLPASQAPSSNCSHCLSMSLKKRFLFCSPQRSRRRTSFGRDKRSVQARVSLLEVTLTGEPKRQRAQASWAAFGMWPAQKELPRGLVCWDAVRRVGRRYG